MLFGRLGASLTPVQSFSLLALLFVAVVSLGIGWAASASLTRHLVDQEARHWAQLIRAEASLAHEGFLGPFSPRDVALFENLRTRLRLHPDVVRVKVWDREARLRWSDEPRLIGQAFPENPNVRRALAGELVAKLESTTEPEHVYERAIAPQVLELYVPILRTSPADVIGVIETYTVPRALHTAIRRVRITLWGIAGLGGVLLYLALFGLFRSTYRTQQRLERALVQAERLRAVGEMASGVAHDFNNVLTVILGRAQLLLSRSRDLRSEGGEQALRVIEKAARDGVETVRRIRSFSRRETQAPRELVDLNAMIQDALEFTRPRWHMRTPQISVSTELAQLPPVRGNPAELREVFVNLIFNALDAMPEGGTLTATSSLARDIIDVTIADTGTGMSDGVKRRIFEPFFTTKGERGTGLGLSVAHGIVASHGGTIDVESKVGRGTRVMCRFPREGGPGPGPASKGG